MSRVGHKRSDRRWRAPDGEVWASRFEYEVYASLKASGLNIRKCDERDSISYCEPKPRVKCLACGSSECVQERIYTPDLFLVPEGEDASSGYYIEAKGYFRGEKRALFRCLRKDRDDIDLRIILESNNWVTRGKTRMTDYFRRYLKNTPCHVWDGDIPNTWK